MVCLVAAPQQNESLIFHSFKLALHATGGFVYCSTSSITGYKLN